MLGESKSNTYIIDSIPPNIAITSPIAETSQTILSSIQGTASDSGTGLQHIELQVQIEMADGHFYLTDNAVSPLSTTPTRLILPAEQTWRHNFTPLTSQGIYNITVRAVDDVGNYREQSIKAYNRSFTTLSLSADSSTLLNSGELNLAGKVSQYPYTGEDLPELPIILTVTAPDGTSTNWTTDTNSLGQFSYGQSNLPVFSQKGQYQFTANFAGTSTLNDAQSIVEPVLVGQSAGYAILVQGKTANNEGLEAHNKTLNRIYQQLLERDFIPENVRYFNYDIRQSKVYQAP